MLVPFLEGQCGGVGARGVGGGAEWGVKKGELKKKMSLSLLETRYLDHPMLKYVYVTQWKTKQDVKKNHLT